MCDPATIASAVAMAGSAVLNTVAQGQAASARDDALAAERIRQSGYDKEAAALNVASQDRYQDFGTQQDKRSSELGDYFKGQTTADAAANQEAAAQQELPQSNSNIVQQEQARQLGKAREFSDQQGAALGNLRSFGDLLGSKSLLQARDAAKVGQIGGFKKGSSAVLPYELEAANSKGAGLKTFADLLGTAGSLGMSYGLRAPAAAASAASSSVNPLSSMASARAADRASVPGYSGSAFKLF